MYTDKLNALLGSLTPALGQHPDADFIITFVEKQRAVMENKISEEDLYVQCVDYIIDQDRYRLSCVINRLNDQVSSGIIELANNGEWSNLSSIAKHAVSEVVKLMKKDITANGDKSIVKQLLDGEVFRQNILSAGNCEFETVITQYFASKGKVVTFTDKV